MACPSVSQCTAVDSGGREVTFNPTAPGTPTPTTIDPGGNGLTGVACPSASQCTAVDGVRGQVTFNPTAPGTPTPTPIDSNGATGVACPSASQCTVIDPGGGQVTFNPTAPGTPTPTTIDPDGDLRAVACASTSECVAVDGFGRAVEGDPGNPGSWTVEPIAGANSLLGVACSSVAQCVTVDFVGNAFVGSATGAGPPPVNVSLPSISGTAIQGETLAETHGLWTNNPTSYRYQWQDCDSSGNACSAIAGATGQSHTLTAGDVGRTIRVQETASNGGGTAGPATSVATAIVAPAPAAGSVSSASGSSSTPGGTASASNAGTSVSAVGVGSLTVSQYGSNPAGQPAFLSSGEFFDVALASGSSFSSVTITDCNLNGGTSLQWWNGNAWVAVSPQSYSPGPPACVTATLDTGSSPTIAQLTGTVFAVANPGGPKSSQTIKFTTSPPANPVFGGSYDVSATGGGSGNPVIFSIDSSTKEACSISGSTVLFIGVGRCVIDANQDGNSDYSAAPQVQQTLDIAKAPTSTALTSSPNPALYAQAVTLTATVSAPGGTPTGSVSFSDGTSPLGSTSLSGGVATLTVSTLALGSHGITAAYSGDGRFAQSTSSSLNQLVQETPRGLCELTVSYVQASPKYRALPPGLRSAINRTLSQVCDQLATITPKLTPHQLALLIAAYKAAVHALASTGWLTSTQASTLSDLAGHLTIPPSS